MLKVYWANSSFVTDEAAPILSEYRKEKLKKLKQETARKNTICAELLLIRALREEHDAGQLPLKIETDKYGKPCLSDGAYCFNVSHSSCYAACALSDHPIGLDLQLLTSCSESLVKRFFSSCEQSEILRSVNPDEAFTRLWCRKESFLKAIGLGLRLKLDSFSVAGDSPAVSYRGETYGFREHRVGDLFFCVCARESLLPKEIPFREIQLP